MKRTSRIVLWLAGAVLVLLLGWFTWDEFLELWMARAVYGDVRTAIELNTHPKATAIRD